MDSSLPFGRTQVTLADFKDSIEPEKAIHSLESKGIPNPEARVDGFIHRIPELLGWLEDYGRDYPWRHTTDPWRIYATEILLQRTRADAVADIYEPFFADFPNPETVLPADDQTIFEKVQSLGLGNHRTRSIREAAELCVNQYDGNVPEDLETLQEPWRVGPYSARACLLFAFNTPMAIVDSNIARIIKRVFDYDMPEKPQETEAVYTLIEAFIPEEPGLARALNFALLDLGALICTERNPQCSDCPLNTCCVFAQQPSSG